MIMYCNPSFANVDHTKYHDYRASAENSELQKMQEFHLQQAKTKMHKQQLAHAWGDFAYLLCHVPNHHQALQHMLTLAPQLHKDHEMREYLTKAMELFPEDAVVKMFYSVFLYNIGNPKESAKFMHKAQKLSAKNNATVRQ